VRFAGIRAPGAQTPALLGFEAYILRSSHELRPLKRLLRLIAEGVIDPTEGMRALGLGRGRGVRGGRERWGRRGRRRAWAALVPALGVDCAELV